MIDDDFILISEIPLEVDEEEPDRAEYTTAEERALRLLGNENRIGVAIRAPELVANADAGVGQVAYDIGLMLVIHAHPECRFVWSRLVVDLTATPGAVIQDMSPDEVEDTAVEMETKFGAGLKFATVLKTVNIEATPELTRKRIVYFPTVTASGTGFRKAYWDFMAKGDSYLHANRELRLLVTAPEAAPVVAALTVRARLRIPGLKSLVPLRKKAGLDSLVTIVSAPDQKP